MSSEYIDGIKKYVIHISSNNERKILVNDIINITGAEIYEAIQSKNGALGCYLSHLNIYKKNPAESLIIFEDDCVINDKNMMSMLDNLKHYDLVYFGVTKMWNFNDKSKRKPITETSKLSSHGTHAMWISARARQIFLDYTNDKPFNLPVDHLWNKIEHQENLLVWRPALQNMYKYCEQKNGLFSTIQKKIRRLGNPKEYDNGVQKKKCIRSTCLYVINKNISNNDGNHCCACCWRGKPGHGPACGRILYTTH